MHTWKVTVTYTVPGRPRAIDVLAIAYSKQTADDIARLVFGNAPGVHVVEEISSDTTDTD